MLQFQSSSNSSNLFAGAQRRAIDMATEALETTFGNTVMRLTAEDPTRRPQAQLEEEDYMCDIGLTVSTYSENPETTGSSPVRIVHSRLVECILNERFDDLVHTTVARATVDSRGVSPDVVLFLSVNINCFALRYILNKMYDERERHSCKLTAKIDVHEWLVVEPSGGGFGGVPASLEAIEAVKETTYDAADVEEGGTVMRGKTCTVCMEDFVGGEELRVMPCEHAFHKQCLDPWLKLSHVCPLCRFAIATEEAAQEHH